jgi:hypothetical protein
VISKPHASFVSALLFVGHNYWTVSGHEIAVWNAKSILISRFSDGHWGRINGLCPIVVGGTRYVLSYGFDCIKLWDELSFGVMITLSDHGDEVTGACQVGEDAIWTASRSGEKSLLRWVFHRTRKRGTN